jgi:hypothetical protein
VAIFNSLEEPGMSEVSQNAVLVVIEGHIAINLLECFNTLSVGHRAIIYCIRDGSVNICSKGLPEFEPGKIGSWICTWGAT